ncbi:membrane protein insertion efficiency factor YidD [Candidatus Microgenomates bacterium]|jgi:hypothetical protein|nr:MAG: membrane protein insertion efficiency factor YidD [Candidatus Microgenomates bacterium]
MKRFLLSLIIFYQKHLSFDAGVLKALFLTEKSCRFEPSCSQYTYEAINKYGIISGGWKGIKRIVKCNPFNRGGYDPLK